MTDAKGVRRPRKPTAADIEDARAVALARIEGASVPTPKLGLGRRPPTASPWRGQLSSYNAIKRGAGRRAG